MSPTQTRRSNGHVRRALQITLNGLIEQHRRIARGLTNFQNYRLRMLLIGGGLNL